MNLFDQIQKTRVNIQQALDSSNRNGSVILIAATKTQTTNTLEDCINNGITHIGENRVQEAVSKFEELKKKKIKCIKRMIGHLQSNKINKAITVFDTIDSIDTISLAKKISIKSDKRKLQIQTMLEVNTGREKNKFGFKPEDQQGMLESIELKNINVVGLMTLGPNTRDIKETEFSFRTLRKIKENLNRQLSKDKQLTELSMGMSSNYKIAIEQGSTMIRLGTALFGRRAQL